MPGYTLGWKAQAALVGAESAVELAAITDVGVGLAGVVGHTTRKVNIRSGSTRRPSRSTASYSG